MTCHFSKFLSCPASGCLLLLLVLSCSQTVRADEQEDFFERQIRPLLIDNCVRCHGPDKQEAGLRLDSRQQVLEGTDDSPALVNIQDVNASRLLQVILYSEDDTQMPPTARLSDPQIAAVRAWIAAGAVWPTNHNFGQASAFDKNAWRSHWAFQPILDPQLPSVYQDGWHPIDAFVRQTLHDKQIAPSPMADGRTLVRRLSYAIVGLPPSRHDLETAAQISDSTQLSVWLNDYATQLLQKPEYGERWARYWLDIARYADTKGYVFQEDREYRDAWRYREWVIHALNADMPYGEFLQRQIAADRLPGADDPAQLAAMGFLTLGRRFLNNKHDIIDDRIDVLARGTLGLTVSCARCHDHKFDPIPTADYYSWYGIFDSSDEPRNEPSPLRLVDAEKPREPVIFLRGSPGNRGEKVARRFLTALSEDEPKVFTDGSGRLELAQEITRADNPLTARIAVNRIWLRLFGQGLVDSPSDFGVRTPPPSHPELLDHLASRFLRSNGSRKDLIQYIVSSMTWRQSSAQRPEVEVLDPENRLLSRMSRRRLDLEAWRDSLLDVAGQLDRTVGGQSVDITTEPFPTRRTVYARIDRQNLPGMFRTFDFASPDNHAPQRYETTVPQQALFQLNNPFVMQQAEHLAISATAEHAGQPAAVIETLYSQVLRRSPTAEEASVAQHFLSASQELQPSGRANVGWQYGWGEMNNDRNSVIDFQHFPVAHEGRWGGSQKLPDEKLGWCMLHKDGGHAGQGLKFCAIRRWVADVDCDVRVTSQVSHSTGEGDGVVAHVIAGSRSHATAPVHNNRQPVDVAHFRVQAGDTVDFVVESGPTVSHDSFGWQITLHQSVDGQQIREWKSDLDFSTSRPVTRLSPTAQLAQTLMLTNEFLFVD